MVKNRDVLFLKKLYKVTTDDEIQNMIIMSDSEGLPGTEKQKLELFFIKIGKEFGSLYEAVLGICENFDFSVDNIFLNTYLLEKLSAEKRGRNKMLEEFF